MADIGHLSVEEVWNLWWCTIRGGLQTLETYIVWCIMESNECNLSGTIEQKKTEGNNSIWKKKKIKSWENRWLVLMVYRLCNAILKDPLR